MKSILFVCLGNICRSPLAQGIAEKIINEKGLNVKVDSVGTGDWHVGEPPCANSIKVAANRGIDISSQRSRQITPDDLRRYELIIALDQSNYDDLLQLGADKPIKLGSFGYQDKDVPDPYFFPGFEGFETVFDMIESCVIRLLEEKNDA